jgi:hypothetical protein
MATKLGREFIKPVGKKDDIEEQLSREILNLLASIFRPNFSSHFSTHFGGRFLTIFHHFWSQF